jgi:hypothetical protein
MSDESELPYKHRYFATYPVSDAAEALWFSKKLTHSMLGLLWQAGPRGLTPTELLKHLEKTERGVGRSIVYQTLRGLYEMGIVDREWDNSAKAHRSIMRGEWLPTFLEEQYEDWLNENFGDIAERILFPAFVKCVNELMKKLEDITPRSEFAPIPGRTGWCSECGYSHQADFFFLSLLYYASESFIDPASWEFNDKSIGKQITDLYEQYQLANPKRNKEYEKFE